jgi:hypothetical protein
MGITTRTKIGAFCSPPFHLNLKKSTSILVDGERVRDDDELLTQRLGELFASNPLPPPHSLLLRHGERKIFLSGERNRSKSRGVQVKMKMRMKMKASEGAC